MQKYRFAKFLNVRNGNAQVRDINHRHGDIIMLVDMKYSGVCINEYMTKIVVFLCSVLVVYLVVVTVIVVLIV